MLLCTTRACSIRTCCAICSSGWPIGHKVRAHWTDQILDEVFENLIVKLARTRVLMGRALPDAKVTGYESLVPALELPTPMTGTCWRPRSGPERR